MDIKSKRIVALIIDLLVVSLIFSFFSSFLNLKDEIGSLEFFSTSFIIGYTYIFIFYFLYFVLFDLIKNGQTFGKKILKIKVVKTSLEKVELKENILRTILKLISIWLLPLAGLFFLLKSTSLHDKICSTLTV